MKKKFLIGLLAIAVLAGGIIFWACNKEDKENLIKTSSEKLVTKNAIQSSSDKEVFVARYNDDESSEMTVQKISDDELVIDTKSIPWDGKLSFKTILFNELKSREDLENGQAVIDIPDDGKHYWLVPFNPEYDVMLVGNGDGGPSGPGGTITVKCICSSNESSTNGCIVKQTQSGSKTEYDCVLTSTNPCSGCCNMKTTIITSGFTPQEIYQNSALLVCANQLTYNGKIYFPKD